MLSNSLTQISQNECIGNSLSAINNNFSKVGTRVDALEASLSTNVQKIVAGSNITISPLSGSGVVTINSTINNSNIVLSGQNLGTTGAGVFKEKSGQNLTFKRIVGSGTNILITEDSNTIKIAALGINGSPGITTQNLGTGVGIAAVGSGSVLPFKSLVPGQGISIASGSTSVIISTALSGKNVGVGTGVYKSLSGNNLLLKSITNGTGNVFIENKANELAIHVNETTTGLNVGTGAYLFKEKLSNGLVFKSLLSSTPNVTITERAQDIAIGVNEITTGRNIGTGTGAIFAQKSGSELLLKTLKKGNNIQLTDNGTEIRIDAVATGSGGEVNEGRNLGSGVEVYKDKNGVELLFRTLSAGPGINVSQGSNVITISAIPPVAGRGDVIGAYNENEAALNTAGMHTGIKTSSGFLTFRSLSGGPNVVITQTPLNVAVQLSGVVTNARNAVFGSGTGEVFKGKTDNILEYRTIKAGPGMSIITGTHDVIISSTLQASLDSLTTSYKNKVINGNFDIWQWATRSILNPTTGNVSTVTDSEIVDSNNSSISRYLADRWAFYAGKPTTGGAGTQLATFSKKQADANDIFAIPSRPSFYGRVTLKSRAVGTEEQIIPTTLFHRIENVFQLAGKKVTLSFYARSNNLGSPTIKLFLNQYYKASYPQYNTYYKDNPITNFNLTSGWQRYSITFNVPTIRKTMLNAAWNSNAPDYNQMFVESFTQIVFELPGNMDRYIDFSSVQLEEGSIATSFEPRPYGAELMLCQRYFETGDSFSAQIGVMAEENRVEIPFKVAKRITPLMRTDNRTVLFKNAGLNSSSNVVNHSFFNVSNTHTRTKYSAYGNNIITNPFVYNWAADAEYFIA
jgi:hypothetical protein